MPDTLYLIAHRVRGAAAFDIAQQMTCPKCEGTDDLCTACEGAGQWWIIPTSGHRAFPYWSLPIYTNGDYGYYINCEHDTIMFMPGPAPIDLRDHYTTIVEAAFDLTKALGFDKPQAPPTPIHRRF